MTKAKVYVQGRAFHGITADVFHAQGNYQLVNNLSESDIVVWTGGDDIDPQLYGEKALRGTYYSLSRDKDDVRAVHEATDSKKFLVGICRGAQLLNVLPNGGRLWQDVNNHGGSIHRTFDCVTGQWVKTNSVHHQALRVTDAAEIVAWALESTKKVAEKDIWARPEDVTSMPEADKDIEACWYPQTKSFCFQGHPEFGHPPTTEYFFGLMDKYYWHK